MPLGRRLPARALVTAVVLAAAIARGSSRTSADPQRLVFLLEYVGTDYGAAVRDGKVVNQLEYGEVLRFTRDLGREYGMLPRRSPAVAGALAKMERLIVDRAPAKDLWTLTRRLVPKVGRTAGGVARPSAIPNLARGRRLWMSDCALCHGGAGAGDGWAAPDMEPPPTAFRGEYLERLSPHQVYNAVSLGVPGTAMPSFADAYTDAQRWDVAFFAMTLRVGFAPRRPAGGAHFALDDLAGSSNAELLAALRKSEPDATAEHVDYFRVTLVSPGGGVAPIAGADAAGAGGLGLALQMQDAFASVAERIFPRTVGVAGYVRDPSWVPERLQTERGTGWVAANADALRYPGFRRVRAGSGLLVDDEGFVVTSNSLVRDDGGAPVPLVEVELADESRIVSAIVGSEPMLDLAVLRVVGELPAPPPALELGDSDRLETGHWLIALGDPPGPERTFAVGLVATAPQRQCYQAALSATRLQSSLVVAEGALGGPVVDILGHVVGLAVRQETAATGGTPGSVLPVNLVLYLLDALKVAQSNRSPWIGVSVLELPLLRKRLGAHPTSATIPATGVYIDDVFRPSPAARAGIRPGDFLVALGGHQVFSVGDFQTWLYVAGIGTTTDLQLVRDGTPMKLAVPIEVRPREATTR